MALTHAQQAALTRADSECLAKVFTALVGNWRHSRWLAARNRYAVDCVERIRQDTSPAGHLRRGQLASYIAASSVIHCMDGWGYVARAVEADLSGDIDAARHLGYYAELRAAMSILASAGLGVFKNKHFVVKTIRNCEVVAGPTHEFIWEALKIWANQRPATDLILRVICPGGKPLSEWLTHFPPATGVAFRGALAQKWLLRCGLDIERLAQDRDARNESSYRPSSIVNRRHPTLAQGLDFIEHFWRAHEPSGLNPFKEIDRHLLRRSLAAAFKATHASGLRPQRMPAQYARLLEPVFHAMLPTGGDFTDDEWKDFLNYREQPNDNHLVLYAESSDPVSSPLHHMQVVARATLLLRVATGAARENLNGLRDVDRNHLKFWWRPIGESRGLWEAGAIPAHFSDLWLDIDASLDRLQSWRSTGGNSRKALFSGAADVIRSLSSCERVALWSLGL